MKKTILTVIATAIVTPIVVYCWDTIVVNHFGWYNYPTWLAYMIVAACAIIGGQIGSVASKIKVNFRKRTTYFVKEL